MSQLSASFHRPPSTNAYGRRASLQPAQATATVPQAAVVPYDQRSGSVCAAVDHAPVQSRQTEVLGMVAHEMRNALMPIRFAAAQLRQPFKDEAQLPRLRIAIERQLAHLSGLVGDLLDASRAVSGKLRLHLVPLEFADVIAEAIDASQGWVTAREQNLCTSLPTAALRVEGDPGRLLQIIGNLLTNASKYTPRGGSIEVSVALSESSLQMTVSDNGIGIAADVLPHVFEPFVQDARAVAFDHAGLGIGLSVVRDLAIAHGGSVVAHSAGHGMGSQFVLTLPLAAPASAASESLRRVRAPLALPGTKRFGRCHLPICESHASTTGANKVARPRGPAIALTPHDRTSEAVARSQEPSIPATAKDGQQRLHLP